jgi:thiazolinyl imide reductase
MTRRTRVVVCGTRFGQVYLEAFTDPDSPFELAGILAGGSERSRACARRYGAPLFTHPDQLPDDITLGCVVVRGGLLGGRGTDLAQALLRRGIHVLQEHPVHHDELAACLRLAHRNRVIHRLNSFYVHVAPVRRFIAAARELLTRQPALYIDAACGFQLAYSLLDVLGQALGAVRPWAFTAPAELPAALRGPGAVELPFRSLDGVFAGVPITLRVQNQLDPADPDNYAHLMHRVTIGTEAGNLSLVGTHGPTVWTQRPDFPREVAGGTARPHFDTAPALGAPALGDEALGAAAPSAFVLGPAEVPGYERVFATMWPAGVARALTDLRDAAARGDSALPHGQYHLTLCQLWQELTLLLGRPQLGEAPPPRQLSAADLAAIAAAGATAAAGDPAPAAGSRAPVEATA